MFCCLLLIEFVLSEQESWSHVFPYCAVYSKPTPLHWALIALFIVFDAVELPLTTIAQANEQRLHPRIKLFTNELLMRPFTSQDGFAKVWVYICGVIPPALCLIHAAIRVCFMTKEEPTDAEGFSERPYSKYSCTIMTARGDDGK